MMRAALLLSILLASSTSSARTTFQQQASCPLSGKTFSTTVEGSGSVVCWRLDLKRVGWIASPPSAPVCDDHGLVLYRAFTPAELEVLRTWVTTSSFSALRDEPSWYRAAQTMRLLHDSDVTIAQTLVAASWQVERDDDHYRRLLGEAAELLHTIVSAHPEPTSPEARHLLLLLAELRRRRGDFGLAQRCLDTLAKRPAAFSVDGGGGEGGDQLAPVIAQVQAAVTKQDRRPHYIGAVDDEQDQRCWLIDVKQQAEADDERHRTDHVHVDGAHSGGAATSP
ncbi:MAG TPA: hypothetical protein VGF99_04865 [Myxococcota bacterium]